MKSSVIIFPGSNCDRDMDVALKKYGFKNHMVWHNDLELPKSDLVVLPGGFSYGDYLRCGSIAGKSKIIKSVIDFANSGGLVLGICNGFQILTESGFLPGALTTNKNLNFICDDVELDIVSSKGGWFNNGGEKQTIKLPIAHGEGRYHCDSDTLKKLVDNELIALRYKNNPNGSSFDIAGITNEKGNVLGLMPHPERACDETIGGTDGLFTLKSLILK